MRMLAVLPRLLASLLVEGTVIHHPDGSKSTIVDSQVNPDELLSAGLSTTEQGTLITLVFDGGNGEQMDISVRQEEPAIVPGTMNGDGTVSKANGGLIIS